MATVPAVEYLENVLAEKFDNAMVVETKTDGGAPEGKENAAPQLPVSGKPSGLDLSGVLSKEQSTPSKKAWNRNAMSIPGTGAATSPSAASTLTPSNDHLMSVSPSSERSADTEAAEPAVDTEKHAALKILAEQYASAKKLHANGSAELATALELVCVAAAKDLHPDPESLTFTDETDPVKRVAAIEQTLREIATPYIPIVDGQITSIGSIPYVTGGIGNCVGLCRFQVKGKCFDGVLCRFSHISRERYMNEGVLNAGRSQRGERSPEKEDSSRRAGRKGMKTTPAKTPPRSQAPFAAPLLTLPTPQPMPMPMMQMPMPMPMSMPTPSKPQSREQAALCELLSSLDVQPEQAAVPPAMPNPYAYSMPMPMPMMNPYAYYDPRMMDPMYAQYYAQWQQQQQCPTVQPVQSLQAQARRKKKGI